MIVPLWVNAFMWFFLTVIALRHTTVIKLLIKATPAMIFSVITTFAIGIAIISGPMMTGDIPLTESLVLVWGVWCYMWAAGVIAPYLLLWMIAGSSLVVRALWLVFTAPAENFQFRRKPKEMTQ